MVSSESPTVSYRRVLQDGLWSNNIVFGQLLALCPLLAVTTTAVNGLGMGAASAFVLTASNVLVSLLRPILARQLRIPMFVIVIATLVTAVDLFMNAYLHELHKVLGLFIPLIVTNCAVLGRAEAFASRNGVLASAVDGLSMGLGFTGALVAIGAIREVVGSGTLFSGADLLLGPAAAVLELRVLPGTAGFLLGVLPPGGFFALALLLGLKQQLAARERKSPRPAASGTEDNLVQLT